jgi:hypothetical protein
MKPFTLRDCGDILVVEIDNIIIVLDKRLEKTHSALRRLEIGLTLDTPLGAIEEFERLLRRRLRKLVVVSEKYGRLVPMVDARDLFSRGLWIGWKT